jgi:acyl-CoA thioesterase FadM
MALGREIGGPDKANALIKAQGVSLILKSIAVKFRRPVTYPDTVCLYSLLPPHGLFTFELSSSSHTSHTPCQEGGQARPSLSLAYQL